VRCSQVITALLVNQFSAVSERSVEGNLKPPTAVSIVLRLSWKATSLKPLSRDFYRCGLRGLASADLFDGRLD
jgi:hypothetical protein